MRLRGFVAAAMTSSLIALQGLSAGEAHGNDVVPLEAFMGCWAMSEATGTMIQYDGFKKDGYMLAEELAMLSVEPVEGGAPFRYLVKGTLDVWSETKGYYMPTIYYDAVYDPVRGALITDSTLYLVDDQMVFVHHRTTSASSDRALRYLSRVDCSEIDKKRAEVHSTYQNAADKPDAKEFGFAPGKSN